MLTACVTVMWMLPWPATHLEYKRGRFPLDKRANRSVDDAINHARRFFAACEQGSGWSVCQAWCTPDATFAAQAEPLQGIRTLAQYTDWMKGLLQFVPDGRYELRTFAEDEERHAVAAYAVFKGTHTGEGGPCPPTGRKVESDYVYVMFFDGDRIRHMQKIWHAGLAMKELGWV